MSRNRIFPSWMEGQEELEMSNFHRFLFAAAAVIASTVVILALVPRLDKFISGGK